MSVNEKMTALADAIRTGAELPEDALSLDAMAAAIPAVRAAGKHLAEAVCAGRHFVTVVHGSGTKSLSVEIPFYPDAIAFVSANPRVCPNQVIFYAYTPHAVYAKGINLYSTASSVAYGGVARQDGSSLVDYTDGVLTASVIETVVGSFADTDYIVLASKTETRTDREILEDFVEGLADTGGSVTLKKATVNAAVTDAEWAALIAAKPNRTFILK